MKLTIAALGIASAIYAHSAAAADMWKCPGNRFTSTPDNPECINIATRERYKLSEKVEADRQQLEDANKLAASDEFSEIKIAAENLCTGKLRAALRDPDSLRVEGVVVSTPTTLTPAEANQPKKPAMGLKVMITFNARNGFGGYAGKDIYYCETDVYGKQWIQGFNIGQRK